jgi:hypothetical protein
LLPLLPSASHIFWWKCFTTDSSGYGKPNLSQLH